MRLVKKYNNIFAILAILFVAGGFSYIENNKGTNGDYQTVVVEAGDTISEIAMSYGADVEEFVSWVEKHNDIEADEITEGQEIVIPVQVEESLVVASN